MVQKCGCVCQIYATVMGDKYLALEKAHEGLANGIHLARAHIEHKMRLHKNVQVFLGV